MIVDDVDWGKVDAYVDVGCDCVVDCRRIRCGYWDSVGMDIGYCIYGSCFVSSGFIAGGHMGFINIPLVS